MLILGGTPSGPSQDQSVYVVSDGTSVEKHKISGEVPSPTQEYAACANEEFMFIHGGLTATGKSNSLYRINLKVSHSRVFIQFILHLIYLDIPIKMLLDRQSSWKSGDAQNGACRRANLPLWRFE